MYSSSINYNRDQGGTKKKKTNTERERTVKDENTNKLSVTHLRSSSSAFNLGVLFTDTGRGRRSSEGRTVPGGDNEVKSNRTRNQGVAFSRDSIRPTKAPDSTMPRGETTTKLLPSRDRQSVTNWKTAKVERRMREEYIGQVEEGYGRRAQPLRQKEAQKKWMEGGGGQGVQWTSA